MPIMPWNAVIQNSGGGALLPFKLFKWTPPIPIPSQKWNFMLQSYLLSVELLRDLTTHDKLRIPR